MDSLTLQKILQYNVKEIERVSPSKYNIEFEVFKKDNAEQIITDIFNINPVIEVEDNRSKRSDFYNEFPIDN